MRSGSAATFIEKRQKKKKEKKVQQPQKPIQQEKYCQEPFELSRKIECELPVAELSEDNSDSGSDISLNGDLNVFVVTFEDMKDGNKNLSGGDPYECKMCGAIVNKYSKVLTLEDYQKSELEVKVEFKPTESLWVCEFCSHPNVISIEKQEIPTKEDMFYMLENEMGQKGSEHDETMVFCIDVSGSMNTTSEVEGKVDLKFGLSEEEIAMLKQFMEPGDEAQFDFLPGEHNKNKTFISRKQCILSAIEAQLDQIKKTDPLKKVGLVTFNNEVTVLGDQHAPTVNIVGDKLNDQQSLRNSLTAFKLTQPINESYQDVLNNLNKVEAKGQTALGPALLSAIEIAGKGSPGSTVVLCTDGLANIGIGNLEGLHEDQIKFYDDLAEYAKEKNISVNIVTIKGEGCKIEVIGKLVAKSNGNVKVVNPENLANDFANVLKDQVVGVNVQAKILLHKAMSFRNEDATFLKENKRVFEKTFANATVNTKISFEYRIRPAEELEEQKIKLEELKTIPFQTQIIYTSPKGGKYLRVISSETKTTMDREKVKEQVNLGVVHTRVTSQTAAMYSKGDYFKSRKFNNKWSQYLDENFQQAKFEEKNQKFKEKNLKLNKAIKHKRVKNQEAIEEEEPQYERAASIIDSDEDEMELMDNIMEKQNYSFDSGKQE